MAPSPPTVGIAPRPPRAVPCSATDVPRRKRRSRTGPPPGRPSNAARPMSDAFANVATLPDVPEAVARAREAVDRLLGHRILRRRSAEVSAESALRGARASAALEGVAVPLEEVRGSLTNDPVVQGTLRVSAELGALADTWRKAPRQALARLHALAAADAVDPDALGRPRPGDEVSDPLHLGAPPPPADVATRLDVL